MRFPKYQWMQEEPINDSCGFCDVLYKTQNAENATGNSFQVILDTNSVSDNKFTSNPFNEITSGSLTFTFNSAFTTGQRTTIYCCGKIFIFKAGSSYSVNIVGNIYEIILDGSGFGGDIMTGLKDAIVANIDAVCGTTTTFVLGAPSTYTIANVPAGSYIDNSLGFFTSVATISTSPIVSYGFHYEGNKICYLDYGTKYTTFQYNFSQSLTTGLTEIIKFHYNSVSTTFGITVTIDDGIDPPTTYTSAIGLSGTIELSYIPTNTGTHTIELILTDPENIKSGFNIERITVQELITVTDLDVEDCNGNITPFSYGNIYLDDTNDNVVLFSLNDNYPEVFRFIITDSADNTLTSRWYKVADKDDCTNGKLYSVKWTNGCNLGEIDYSALPFTNELLLSGVLLKSDTDLIDSVENITASGRKISIYKNTQSVYEFRMHPYLSDTFEIILEGIFAHDTVTIDGIEYNTTDKVQISELDLGVYTGRVDLYKDGTNLITKNCC